MVVCLNILVSKHAFSMVMCCWISGSRGDESWVETECRYVKRRWNLHRKVDIGIVWTKLVSFVDISSASFLFFFLLAVDELHVMSHPIFSLPLSVTRIDWAWAIVLQSVLSSTNGGTAEVWGEDSPLDFDRSSWMFLSQLIYPKKIGQTFFSSFFRRFSFQQRIASRTLYFQTLPMVC